MKSSDHNVEMLHRSLKQEAESLRERAKKLDILAQAMMNEVKAGESTPHTFEFVGSEAIDITTHRSNVHLQSIARCAASLAADAAVEWVEKQETKV